MNQVKNQSQVNEVTLEDLRRLGRQGGVTARLDDGSTVLLRARFGTVKRKGYIAGTLTDVDVIVDFVKIYSQIRTIKQKDVLIARRIGQGSNAKLILTGNGYKKG
ncbi:TPA: hypothetical protein TXJ06_001410 [Streptococcus suis]|nr:hypothetical protein [Streptococcus suis]MBY5020855.1 hypothetical protein [Streptococcus suis]MCQ8264807.1 hypothetical protein [Streptococcus suis]HEL1584673.1 hypothetical protein [Streptococcus suis]